MSQPVRQLRAQARHLRAQFRSALGKGATEQRAQIARDLRAVRKDAAGRGGARGFQLEGIDEATRSVGVVASTSNPVVAADGVPEILRPNWNLERFSKNPVILWSHDTSLDPLGTATDIEAGADGLRMRVKFATAAANPEAEHKWNGVREGTIRGVSVSWSGGTITYSEIDGVVTRVVDAPELDEVSLVAVPADEDALVDGAPHTDSNDEVRLDTTNERETRMSQDPADAARARAKRALHMAWTQPIGDHKPPNQFDEDRNASFAKRFDASEPALSQSQNKPNGLSMTQDKPESTLSGSNTSKPGDPVLGKTVDKPDGLSMGSRSRRDVEYRSIDLAPGDGFKRANVEPPMSEEDCEQARKRGSKAMSEAWKKPIDKLGVA